MELIEEQKMLIGILKTLGCDFTLTAYIMLCLDTKLKLLHMLEELEDNPGLRSPVQLEEIATRISMEEDDSELLFVQS